MFYIDSKYQERHFFPPKTDIPTDKKDAEYHRKWAEYIYSNDIHGGSVSFCRERDKFSLLRKYSEGRQPVEKYMDIWLGKKQPGDAKRKAYSNINYDILPIAPKYKNVVLNLFEEVDYEMSADAVDEHSVNKKQELKLKLWFQKENQKLIKQIRETMGLEYKPPRYLPANRDELDLYEQMGGLKLEEEIAVEKACDYIDSISKKEEVARRVKEDFYVVGVGAFKDIVEPSTQQVKYKYVDPARLIVIGGHDSYDKEKASAFGYLTYYNIADMRMKMPDVKEEEWLKIAQKYEGKLNNRYLDSDLHFYPDESGSYAYDDIIVPVLEFEFADIDRYYRTRRKTRYGDEIDREERFGKVYDTEKKKTRIVDIKVWRKGTWVIGTDKICDYGLQNDIPRPVLNPSEAYSSFHVYNLPDKSIQEQINPVLDSIQLNHLRYQNLKAQGKFSTVAIEFTALQNISLGGKKLKPLDLIKIYSQQNVLFYKHTTHGGQFYTGGKPVETLPSGIDRDTETIVKWFKTDFDLLTQITGINEIVSAGNPNPEVGLGQSEIAIQSSNNILKTILRGWKNLYGRVMRNAVLRLQVVAKSDTGDKLYEGVIGKKSWKAIKMGSKKPMSAIGIKLNPKITEAQKRDIEEKLSVAMQGGKNGNALITASEYFAIKRMLESGTSIKYIQVFLAHREQKNIQEQRLNEARNYKAQQQSAIASEQAKTKKELMVEKEKTDNKIREIKAQEEEERKTERVKEEEKRKTIELEYRLGKGKQMAETT